MASPANNERGAMGQLSRRPQVVVTPVESRSQRLAAAATALAAVGALVFSGWSIQFTGRSVDVAADSAAADREQVALSRQGQITDRFARSVEQLGNTQISVRIGAIYALERIMRDSPADQPTVMEVLGGFVREQAKNNRPIVAVGTNVWPKLLESQYRNARVTPPTDVQAAVTVLGRRNLKFDAETSVDLSGADLSGVTLSGDFQGANLARASMFKSILEGNFDGAVLNESDLAFASASPGTTMRGARMRAVRLTSTSLASTNLSSADLWRATADDVIFSGANLSRALFTESWLPGANFRKADLAGAKFFSNNLEGARLSEAVNPPETFQCASVNAGTALPRESRVESKGCVN
ncbi:pentapeptide repeat-containing protein [Micromonospora chalcea]